MLPLSQPRCSIRPHAPLASLALTVLVTVSSAVSASAGQLHVPSSYSRVTDALAAASSGDTVLVMPGTYSPSANGEVFPLTLTTNGVTLLGAGAGASVLDAEDQGSVVVFASTQGRVSGFTLTRGRAPSGGGVRIDSGTPEIDHNWILRNGATLTGSGIYSGIGTAPWIHHNVVWESYDTDVSAYGDPHGVQLVDANGTVEHNLIGRGDSNGLINTGNSKPTVRNNILYQNGIPGLRGRGFCALGDTTTTIVNNLFFGNQIAPLIVRTPGGPVNMSATQANDYSFTDPIANNFEGDPLFVDADGGDWHLQAGSPAIDAGDPLVGPDPDGTPPDVGPYFHDQSNVGVPGANGLLALLPSTPNPFSTRTLLRYVQAEPGWVRLSIHDLRGRTIGSIVDGLRGAGLQTVAWDGRDSRGALAPSGIYTIRLQVAGQERTSKIVLTR